MDITGLLIQLMSGAAGGNLAGAVLKKYSLGTVGNSIVGILGGGLGGQLLGILTAGGTVAASGAAGGSVGFESIAANVAGGGIGGAVLMLIVGVLRKAMAKS